MQKRDDKVGEKTPIKKERREKRERERKVEIDSQKVQILAIAQAWKTKKKLFNYVRLVGKYAFFLHKTRF